MTLNRYEKKSINLQALTREAISLATQGRWQEAADLNREIIEICPNDVNAYNRLGKALMELGHYALARHAFQRSLEITPSNAIAKKNLQRLSLLTEAGAIRQGGQIRISAQHFIEETGKTGVANLINLGPKEVRIRLGAGDPIQLRMEGCTLKVDSIGDDYIGQVEQKLALRLMDLIQGGNRYEGVITRAGEKAVTVILREVYQDPSQAGKVSFPSRGADGFRSYVKESILKYELEEKTHYQEEEPTSWEEDDEPEGAGVPDGVTIIDGEGNDLPMGNEEEEAL